MRSVVVFGIGMALGGCSDPSALPPSALPPTSSRLDALAAAREVERSECLGVPDADRDGGLLSHRDLVLGVSGLDEKVPWAKTTARLSHGATVLFRATPGLTAPWLTRVARCHVARAGTTDLPGREDDPLAARAPDVTVRETDSGLAMDITASDIDSAREILRRASKLGVAP